MKFDAIEVLELCSKISVSGSSDSKLLIEPLDEMSYYQLWRTESDKVRTTLNDLLCGDHVMLGLELLSTSGALNALIPEFAEIQHLADDPQSSMHKNVWEHTKQVVASTPAELDLRWGALLHDIGKARTRRIIDRRVTFHGHDAVGAKMLDSIEHRLHLFKDESLFATVRALILNHLRPANYKKSWTDSGVRRLLSDLGGMQNFEKLMKLSRADLTTKNMNKRKQAVQRGNELEERVKLVFACDNAPKLPKSTMGIVMSKLPTVKPGRWLNDVRDHLENMMAVGILPLNETPEYYAQHGISLVEQYLD